MIKEKDISLGMEETKTQKKIHEIRKEPTSNGVERIILTVVCYEVLPCGELYFITGWPSYTVSFFIRLGYNAMSCTDHGNGYYTLICQSK